MNVDESGLVNTYRLRIFYIALKRLRDRDLAEEITQETLTAVIEALRNGRILDQLKIPAYIFAVLRNQILQVYRRRSEDLRLQNCQLQPAVPWTEDPDAELLIEEQKEAVRRALATMRSGDREILRRCFVEGQSLEEIASELQISYTAVRKRKSRALERLRKIWARMSQNKRK